MSHSASHELPVEARLALGNGRRVEAIRIVRERTGLALSEATALVDHAQREVGTMRHRPASREDRGGWRLIAAVILLGGIAAALLLM